MWSAWLPEMRRVIGSDWPDSQKLTWAQRTPMFAINDADPATRHDSIKRWDTYLTRRWGNWLKTLRDNRLEESKHYPEEFVSTFDGLRLSLDFCKKLNIALEAIGIGKLTGKSRVLELGAGFGQVGRILMALRPGLEYVICDLPESLYFAERFLRANGCNYRQVAARLFKDISGRFDCFINTSSLGEMPSSVASAYLDHFQRNCDLRSCVLLNRMLNTYSPWREANRERECGWYFALDNLWDVKTWDLEPEFTTFPGVEQIHARELLFVASRASEPLISHGIIPLYAITRQLWCSTNRHAVNSRLHHIFAWDKALLRELFERVRTNPGDRKAFGILLDYLDRIAGPYPFEEMAMLFKMYGWSRHGPTWLRNLTSSLSRRWFQIRHGKFFTLAPNSNKGVPMLPNETSAS